MITVLAQNKSLVKCKAIIPYDTLSKYKIEGYVGVGSTTDDGWDGSITLGEYTTEEQRNSVLDMIYNHLCYQGNTKTYSHKGNYGEDLGIVTYPIIFKMPEDLPQYNMTYIVSGELRTSIDYIGYYNINENDAKCITCIKDILNVKGGKLIIGHRAHHIIDVDTLIKIANDNHMKVERV